MKKKILLAFDDPGGGLAVTSLISRLRNENSFELVVYSGKLSRKFLNNLHDEFKEIPSFINKTEAEEIIEIEKPELILTGTGGGNAEQELRNVAHKKNIKSIVILDFWKDYTRRWKYSDYSFDEMKDIICVMDDLTREEMIRENFKKETIRVTGHPYLDKLFNYNPEEKSETVLKNNSNNFLFLSQPLEIIGVKDYDVHPLEIFINALRKLSLEKKQNLSLKIRLHPSELKSDEISEISGKYNSESIKINIVPEEESLDELIKQSTVVIGYNTIALFESRAFGKRTISLKVAEIKKSLEQAMLTAGIEITEPDEESISSIIFKEYKNSQVSGIFKGGIENCASLILKELNN